jgi:hypothetical protein
LGTITLGFQVIDDNDEALSAGALSEYLGDWYPIQPAKITLLEKEGGAQCLQAILAIQEPNADHVTAGAV